MSEGMSCGDHREGCEGDGQHDANTSHDERDPWLSPDRKLLFFSSDRDGKLNIYVASSLEH